MNIEKQKFPVFYGAIGSAGICRVPLEKYFKLGSVQEYIKIYFGYESFQNILNSSQQVKPYEKLISGFDITD